MLTIKINGEKTDIPEMNELTVKQYIEFVKTNMNLVDYLSVVLNKSFKEAFDLKVSGINKLLARLGELKDYSKLAFPKKLIVDDKYYFTKRIEISTVGQRFMIEENAQNLKDEELFCFILAVAVVANPMDIDEINAMKERILKAKYIDVLPVAFFLASRFLNGRQRGTNYLKMLSQLVKTRICRFRPASKDSISI